MSNIKAIFFVPALLIAFIACGAPPRHLFKITDSRGNIGFIDIDGRVIVEPRYQQAGEFIDGIALVKLNGKYRYIDRKGKTVWSQ